MRKIIFLVLLVTLMLVSFSTANAEVLGRKVFAMSGEFIEFIPFSFTVPSGNCGNVRTFEYEPSYNYPAYTSAHWQELAPGTEVKSYSVGIFKFVVDGSICSPEFVVEGTLNEYDIYGIWSGIEQDPEDLGVLVRGIGVATNYFHLPTNDGQYSYVIVFSPFGRKYSLDDLVTFAGSGNGGIQPSGSTLVGAIISDERGFFNHMIFNPKNLTKSIRGLNNQSKNIIMYDDQPVVLIYKENY